jgi:DNA sulfur modification protein DndD
VQLNSISLINFGVFRGRHTIDLQPVAGRSVVLFGGKNGAGKTTLLEALYLCLYGSLALGPKVSREQYAHHLDRRIHSSPVLLVQPTFASVGIEFSYSDAGRLHRYEVTRSWGKSSGSKTAERLDVKKDGDSLGELGSEQWQDFIRELIPPGVSSLFFFDGEKIQQLADDLTDQTALAGSIKALLGVNLVERLQSDIAIYQSRLSQTRADDHAATKLDELSVQLGTARTQVVEKQMAYSAIEAEVATLRAQLAQAEQALTAEGGGFAKRRETLIKRREEAKAVIATIEANIRALAAGLLPFAIVPDLLKKVKAQLLREQAVQASAGGAALLDSARTRFTELVNQKVKVGSEKKMAETRAEILRIFDDAVQKARTDLAAGTQVHHDLSPTVTQQVLSWIDQSLGPVPENARAMSADLELRYRDLQRATEELRKVPEDDVLAPLLAQLSTFSQQIGDKQRQLLTTGEDLRSAESKERELRRLDAAERQRLERDAKIDARMLLLPRIQTSLESFAASLVAERLEHLQAELTRCFNRLSRKSERVKRVRISPEDFSVVLFDRADSPLPKQALSAGEKQIYAIAMLWALGRVSRRPLPLIIDTPLGRLDSDHRRLLVERYFPHASHQVILLSTDTEIDQVYFQDLRPSIARCYRLDFDMENNCTSITDGYFEAPDETHKNQAYQGRIQSA